MLCAPINPIEIRVVEIITGKRDLSHKKTQNACKLVNESAEQCPVASCEVKMTGLPFLSELTMFLIKFCRDFSHTFSSEYRGWNEIRISEMPS